VRTTALNAQHRTLGAKLVEFGGWEMPISYPTGTIAEHLACRNSAVVFDVSHLGTVRVEGAQAFNVLQKVLSNDLRKIAPGRTQYTHLLDPSSGDVLDDIIVWWVAENIFDVMPNASNTDRVVQYLGGVDTTQSRCVIALQGPRARNVMSSLSVEASEVPRNHVQVVELMGTVCVVAGTGYTGEDGIEIAVPVSAATELWHQLVSNGVLPAGLGARDTLRLEAGLPLHGHELGVGITSLQANLGWVLGWNKDEFQGKEVVLREKETGVTKKLVGLFTEGRRPPREGSSIAKDGAIIGSVTSGNFSPMLEHGIALGFVQPNTEIGDEVTIDVRGTELSGRVVSYPFYKKAI
jgi:aminomethyltransferase